MQISSLPFLDSRDTRQYTHVYNHDCSEWGDTGDGPDVVYKYRPESDVVLDINLCESDYDSKVYLYRNEEEEAYACNDDRCGYQSRLRVKLTAGDDFYIMVDGYSGDSGKFILEIKAIAGIDPLKLPPGEVDESVNPLPDPDEGSSNNGVEMLALSLTNCELSPAFSPAETSYACRVPPGGTGADCDLRDRRPPLHGRGLERQPPPALLSAPLSGGPELRTSRTTSAWSSARASTSCGWW